MTFKERYQREETWHGKAMIMEIYHLAMTSRERGWTITKTAQHFQVSIGLVSENLRLANAMHIDERIIQCDSRQNALKKIDRRSNVRDVEA